MSKEYNDRWNKPLVNPPVYLNAKGVIRDTPEPKDTTPDCTKRNPCGEELCKTCCPHEFDSSEGGYCLNCETHQSEV